MRPEWLVCLSLILIGCATKPVSDEDMQPVPEARILAPTILDQRPGTFSVIVKRDSEFRIAPCMARVFVDGQQVADLAPGEGITMYLAPGDRMLAAELCPVMAGGKLVEVLAPVGEGQHSKYRISGSGGEHIKLQPTAF